MNRLNGMALTAFLLLAGCVPKVTPYQMEIQQGNVVTQEMLSKLQPGMTPSQVRFILGTPLVVDAFHKDRWDYVYRVSKGSTVHEQRRIVVVFQDDKLARIEGDVVPGKAGGATDGGVKIDKPTAASKPAATASPNPDPAAPAPPAGSKPATATGEPGSDKPKDQQAGEEKPKEERGFFGRMLERMGF